jgi:hypothetical protein
MMSLKLMRNVMLDIEREGAIVHAVLDRWAHDPGSAASPASANFVFTFTDGGAPSRAALNDLSDGGRSRTAEIEVIRHWVRAGF